MRSLIAAHGDSKVAGQEALSNAKAETIYRILDANSEVYQPVNHKDVRSRMNICFRVKDAATEKEFLEGAEARLLQGLKGHRSVGGIRASNYNAVRIHFPSPLRLCSSQSGAPSHGLGTSMLSLKALC